MLLFLGITIKENVSSKLKHLSENIKKMNIDTMRKCVEIGIKEVRRAYYNAPNGGLHYRTGVLYNSFDMSPKGGSYSQGTTGTTVKGVVGSAKFYSIVHEYGKTIKPGAKGFLAWPNPLFMNLAQTRFMKNADKMVKRAKKLGIPEGKYIFTTKPVHIPARPFVRPAGNKLRPRVIKAFKDAVSVQVQRTDKSFWQFWK